MCSLCVRGWGSLGTGRVWAGLGLLDGSTMTLAPLAFGEPTMWDEVCFACWCAGCVFQVSACAHGSDVVKCGPDDGRIIPPRIGCGTFGRSQTITPTAVVQTHLPSTTERTSARMVRLYVVLNVRASVQTRLMRRKPDTTPHTHSHARGATEVRLEMDERPR